MKIKVKKKTWQQVKAMPKQKHLKPRKPMLLFRLILKIVGVFDLWATHFKAEFLNEIPKKPALILMNHSSFIDLEIASSIFYSRPMCIVCTSDAFVGKKLLMRLLGCIPTNKFVTDMTLIKDMHKVIKQGASVLMYPEASYSFDGCSTTLPQKLGTLVKFLNVPVIMVKTSGAFLRDPLYNGLQKRKTKVSATVETIIDEETLKTFSPEKISQIIQKQFEFDNFKQQQEQKIKIDEPFRADFLERILYKCSACKQENCLKGKGTKITCQNCGKTHTLSEYGFLSADDGEQTFTHIPDWFLWEREKVKKEIEEGRYVLDCEVNILVLADFKAIYDIGKGRLVHNEEGFKLYIDDEEICSRSPLDSYGLYADYYWYSRGDIICIGDKERLYYCLPQTPCSVAKARLATEELYKLKK